MALSLGTALAGMPPAPQLQVVPGTHTRRVQEICYPSGLRITVVPDERQPVVSVTAVVSRGSAHDPAGREGTTHLLEHLWFRAKPGRGDEVSLRLDRSGAVHNAYTMADTTVYLTIAPETALAELLALEAARLADPLVGVTEAVIANERSIVRSELALGGELTDPLRLFPAGFFDATTGYEGLAPATPASIDAITEADLREAAAAYRPDQVTLHITGDTSAAKVRELAARAFPKAVTAGTGTQVACAGHGPEVRDVQPEAARLDGLQDVTWPVQEPFLLVGWTLPPAYGDDETLYRVAVRTLEIDLSDRLRAAFGRDVDRYAPECGYFPRMAASAALCAIRVPERQKPERVLERVKTALYVDEAAGGLVTQLADLFLQAETTEMMLGMDDLSGLQGSEALRDALSNHFTGSFYWYASALEAAIHARPQQVLDARRSWLTGRRAVGLWVHPPGAEATVVRLEDRTEPEASFEPTSHFDRLSQPATGGGKALYPRFPTAYRSTLGNGLEVMVVPMEGPPVARVSLMVDGGPWIEPVPGIDAWTSMLLTKESLRLPVQSYGLGLASIGARLTTAHSLTRRTWRIAGPLGNLGGLLYLLRAQAEQQVSQDRNAWREVARAAEGWAEEEKRSLGTRLTLAGWRHVVGAQHTLARTFTDDLMAGRGIRQADLARWADVVLRPENARVVVVGPVDPEQARDEVERFFASWSRPAPTTGKVVRPPAAPGARTVFAAAVPGAERGWVELICRGPERPGGAVTRVVGDLARHQAWTSLRESSIGAYAPWASASRIGDLSLLQIGADVRAEDVPAAVQALVAAVEQLGGGVPTAAVEGVVQRELKGRAIALLGTLGMQRLAEWDAIPRSDGDPTGEALRAVDTAAVTAWMGSCVGHEAILVTVPDPAALDGLGLPVQVVEVEALP